MLGKSFHKKFEVLIALALPQWQQSSVYVSHINQPITFGRRCRESIDTLNKTLKIAM